MARLIHLNGPPGIGKSTISSRYVAEHPGVLNLDVDVLRSMIGGWQDDFSMAGALIRPAALAMVTAYLSGGHDVLLPQLLVKLEELERFEDAATQAGAGFRELVLMDSKDKAVSRFNQRGTGDIGAVTSAFVRANGGAVLLGQLYDDLAAVVAARPDATVINSVEGSIDQTYAAVLSTLGPETAL